MNPFSRLFGFVGNPSHSRTFGILAFLIIVLAIPLTVNIAQKQQELRQQAAEQCPAPLVTDCGACAGGVKTCVTACPGHGELGFASRTESCGSTSESAAPAAPAAAPPQQTQQSTQCSAGCTFRPAIGRGEDREDAGCYNGSGQLCTGAVAVSPPPAAPATVAPDPNLITCSFRPTCPDESWSLQGTTDNKWICTKSGTTVKPTCTSVSDLEATCFGKGGECKTSCATNQVNVSTCGANPKGSLCCANINFNTGSCSSAGVGFTGASCNQGAPEEYVKSTCPAGKCQVVSCFKNPNGDNYCKYNRGRIPEDCYTYSDAATRCSNPLTAASTAPSTAPSTAAQAPSSVVVLSNLTLHGLGTAGDVKNPSQRPTNPRAGKRKAVVEVTNIATSTVTSAAQVTPDLNSNGTFTVRTSFPNLPTANYTVKIKTDGFLKKSYGNITLNLGQTVTLSNSLILTAAELNGDNKINILDYNILSSCFGQGGTGACSLADTDDTGTVDLFDFNLLVRELNNTTEQTGE